MPAVHYPKYFWHPKLHEEWAGESLHYYRISFVQRLDKNAIVKALSAILQKYGVTSYSWNETYGTIDIVLRIWLRPDRRPELFHNKLRDDMGAYKIDCHFGDSFHVEKIYYHWRWQDITVPPIDHELVEHVNDGRKTASVKRALADHFVKVYNGRDGRIHFYIGIPGGNNSTDIQEVIPPRILRRYQHHPQVKHLSIYLGTGGGYKILVEADVAETDYRAIANVSSFLNELGCLYGAKTETHLVTGPSKTSFFIVDHLAVPRERLRQVDLRSYGDYGTMPENNELEKKATIFTDFRQYLATGKKQRDPHYLKEGPLKALVGMLHSVGGEIVIGLLEDKKIPPQGKSRLENCEKIGDFYVTGIEAEENYRSWDEYELQLRQAIDNIIKPGLAGTGLYHLNQIPAGGVSLAVITVLPALSSEWYNIEEKFYVRDGNRTKPIPASELRRYQGYRERRERERTKRDPKNAGQ
jgi:hypothetical protein